MTYCKNRFNRKHYFRH